MKNIFVLASVVFVILFQLSCGADEDQMEEKTQTKMIEKTETSTDDEKTILENMSESEVRQLTSDSTLEMVTVVEGSRKTKLKVRFRGV